MAELASQSSTAGKYCVHKSYFKKFLKLPVKYTSLHEKVKKCYFSLSPIMVFTPEIAVSCIKKIYTVSNSEIIFMEAHIVNCT